MACLDSRGLIRNSNYCCPDFVSEKLRQSNLLKVMQPVGELRAAVISFVPQSQTECCALQENAWYGGCAAAHMIQNRSSFCIFNASLAIRSVSSILSEGWQYATSPRAAVSVTLPSQFTLVGVHTWYTLCWHDGLEIRASNEWLCCGQSLFRLWKDCFSFSYSFFVYSLLPYEKILFTEVGLNSSEKQRRSTSVCHELQCLEI